MMDKLIKSNMMNKKIWNKVKNDDLQLSNSLLRLLKKVLTVKKDDLGITYLYKLCKMPKNIPCVTVYI